MPFTLNGFRLRYTLKEWLSCTFLGLVILLLLVVTAVGTVFVILRKRKRNEGTKIIRQLVLNN